MSYNIFCVSVCCFFRFSLYVSLSTLYVLPFFSQKFLFSETLLCFVSFLVTPLPCNCAIVCVFFNCCLLFSVLYKCGTLAALISNDFTCALCWTMCNCERSAIKLYMNICASMPWSLSAMDVNIPKFRCSDRTFYKEKVATEQSTDISREKTSENMQKDQKWELSELQIVWNRGLLHSTLFYLNVVQQMDL